MGNPKKLFLALFLALPMLLAVPPRAHAERVRDYISNLADRLQHSTNLDEVKAVLKRFESLNGKIDDIFAFEKNIEDIRETLKEVGYLVDATKDYNNLIKRSAQYSSTISQWGGDLDNYTREFNYLNRVIRNGEKLVDQYKKFLEKFQTSDKKKIDEIYKTRQEFKAMRDSMDIMMNNLEKQHFLAQEIQGFSELVNANSSSQDYAQSQARRHAGHYGATSDEDIKAVGSAWGRLINIILGIILGVLVFGAIVIYFRGAGVGDMTSEQVFLRLFVAAVIDTFLLVLYNGVISL